MFALYVEAPFAVFRTFAAGWYCPTGASLTPSAAYGLLLNVAGIESRLREGEAGHDVKTPATLTKTGLPIVELAIGAEFMIRGGRIIPCELENAFPRVQTMFQQLHNYPVGTSARTCRIVEREQVQYYSGSTRVSFRIPRVIALRGKTNLGIRAPGLAGEFNSGRYGIPFLGDNAFLSIAWKNSPTRAGAMVRADYLRGWDRHPRKNNAENAGYRPR